MISEDIRLYLPKYLSEEAEEKLFDSLMNFPNNLDDRFYTSHLENEEIAFQGDGIRDLLVINFKDMSSNSVHSMVLSNTCDIAVENKRLFPSQIVYAPIFNLAKYRDNLLSKSTKSPSQIQNHIAELRKQRVTQVFYLPAYPDRLEESIVFLDRLYNCPNTELKREDLKSRRIFTLSDYGAYLFILKLSIHFTRIQDRVERRTPTASTSS